jgi:hypothetical protein
MDRSRIAVQPLPVVPATLPIDSTTPVIGISIALSKIIIMFRLAHILFLTVVTSVTAFTAPSCNPCKATTELCAVNRRDTFGLLFGTIMTTAISSIVPDISNAANPALETFKGGKKTKGSFIPGKGMRDHESSLDTLVASNPALETFKGSKQTKGAFIPGKGLRDHGTSLEKLMAANPALETFKGRKRTTGSFVPGKGMRNHESTFTEFLMSKDMNSNFDTLIAANPALETFKGRKRTSGSFTPGKGYVFTLII